ncbi:putative aldose 1-epimerase protein [Zalerion maritima]|uniref:Aldose 1-epimerase protein n=1 Tax=Zalerion maritima TaxID=339359 RepID=A0AAD5RJD4_9PEZI|nr:putative aldose 1-epimerase protein [Zalerion maritima]
MTIKSALLYLCALALPSASTHPSGHYGSGTGSGSGDVIGPDSNGKYWVYGNGIKASFIEYGASVSNLYIADKTGVERDIVAGFDNATYYGIDSVHPHFGGVPGRYANRIKNSTFEIDGEVYNITPNDNPTEESPDGADTLHGGSDGWDYRNFTVVAHTNSSITFSIVDPDGKEGFPGEVVSYITYTLGHMRWDFEMTAFATTKKTPIMLTSHAYWNLDGFQNTETSLIFNHSLHMPYSGMRVGVDNILIPTGELLPNYKGGVNDFYSESKEIGSSFGDPDLQNNCGWECTGYDNCYVANRLGQYDWEVDGYIASISSPWSGIKLDIFSDQEAFQFYSCNFQDGTMPLKETQGFFGDDAPFPRTIPQYGCFVVEVQDYIDGINQPAWQRESKQIFGPGDGPYVLKASYRFSIEDFNGQGHGSEVLECGVTAAIMHCIMHARRGKADLGPEPRDLQNEPRAFRQGLCSPQAKTLQALQVIAGKDDADPFPLYICRECISVSDQLLALLAKLENQSKSRVRWNLKTAYVRLNVMPDIAKLRRRMESLSDKLSKHQHRYETLGHPLWPVFHAHIAHDPELMIHVANFSEQLDRVETMVNATAAMAKDIHTIVATYSHTPRELGYPWETGDSKDHVGLDDGHGGSFCFPLELCSTPEVLSQPAPIPPRFRDVLLLLKYTDKDGTKLPGFEEFKEHNFELLTWDDEQPIQEPAERWNDIFTPGSMIKVSWVKDHFSVSLAVRGRKCPRCGKRYSEPKVARQSKWEFDTCKSCGLNVRTMNPMSSVLINESPSVFEFFNKDEYWVQRRASTAKKPRPSTKSFPCQGLAQPGEKAGRQENSPGTLDTPPLDIKDDPYFKDWEGYDVFRYIAWCWLQQTVEKLGRQGIVDSKMIKEEEWSRILQAVDKVGDSKLVELTERYGKEHKQAYEMWNSRLKPRRVSSESKSISKPEEVDREDINKLFRELDEEALDVLRGKWDGVPISDRLSLLGAARRASKRSTDAANALEALRLLVV